MVSSALPAVPLSAGAARPVLFLFADTGGGHRSAAVALSEALSRRWPGTYAPVLLDPLGGPRAAGLPRLIARLYAPVTRWAPWLWGAVYHLSDSAGAMFILRRTVFRPISRTIERNLAVERPASVVVVHPLLTEAAVRAGRRSGRSVPVLTVVTDLASIHTAWFAETERTLLPLDRPAGGALRIRLPVPGSSGPGALRARRRDQLRQQLGADVERFLVVVTGGGEGSGGIARRTRALLDAFDDVQVVAICGRNRRAERRLRRRAGQWGGRLIVKGFVNNLADWFDGADLVVTKAGPGTLAEATCRGAALLITSHLPGQETGNAELLVAAGAARQARRVGRLVREVRSLRRDRDTLAAMLRASLGLADPAAAEDVAAVLHQLAAQGRARAT